MSEKELLEIGRTLGADVDPCYYSVAVKGEGIGDIITPINTRFKYYILVIKPKISYSTKDMFYKLDERPNIIKKEICKPSLMTGSGSCVYGIFKDKYEAKSAYNLLKQKYETYICTSYNKKNRNECRY